MSGAWTKRENSSRLLPVWTFRQPTKPRSRNGRRCMSEDEATSAQSETPSPGPDGAAWAVLGAASREKADAFLDEQRELTQEQKILVHLQAKDLAHELNLRRWSHRVHHVSDVLKVAFELAVAAIALAVV